MAFSSGRFSGWFLGLVFLLFVAGLQPGEADSFLLGLQPDAPMDVSADRIEYDAAGPYMIGHGNVEVRQGDRVITADYIQVNTQTDDAYARGSIAVLRAGEPVWRGEELIFNLRTGIGDFGAFSLFVPPYQIRGEDSTREGRDLIRIGGVMVSPCEGEAHREFRITAREARLREQRYVWLRHARVWLGPVPVLYSPFWYRDLEARGRWSVEPWYRSRHGVYVRARYTVPLDERRIFLSRTHMHAYQHRGFALGQDVRWDAPAQGARGEVRVFGLDDRRMYVSDEEQERREAYLDHSFRYRLQLRHNQTLTDRDLFFLETTYVSDPFFLEDFLRSEHRAAPQPDNRFGLTHRADAFTASLSAQVRLNDFYHAQERLPEVQLRIPRLQLGGSPFYYEGDHSGVSLRRVFPRDSEEEEFDTVRLDSYHRLFYPGHYFGFLSVTPRAGLRATYYSRTYGRIETVPRTVVRTDPETGEDEIVDTEETVRIPGSAELRLSSEIGVDSSYKAFKVLTERPVRWGDGLRHMVEPYGDYAWRPKPNIRAHELYPFDAIDRVDLDHRLRLGVRNKLQTRRVRRSAGRPADSEESGPAHRRPGQPSGAPREILDVVDADIFSTFRIESLRGEDFLGPLEADVRLRPSPRVYLQFDAAYVFEESEINRFNARSVLSAADGSSLEIEYRYQVPQRNLVSAVWSFRPRHTWSLEAFHRFDLDEGKLAEHGYGFARRHSCIGWGVGVRHEPRFDPGERDDFRFWAQIWLLADPASGFGTGG